MITDSDKNKARLQEMHKTTDLLLECLSLNKVSVHIGVECLLIVAITRLIESKISKKEIKEIINSFVDGLKFESGGVNNEK